MTSLSIAEVKSRFSEVVSRVAGGERVLIKRRTKPVAILIGADELERLERSANLGRQMALALGQNPSILEQIDKGLLHPAMVAYGLWKDEDDLAHLEAEVYENRSRQNSRPVPVFED